MKITHLDIEYFRCFDKYHIAFAPGITVLIGKNGAGKSTLINAVHKAMSFVFKKDTTVKNDRTLSSGIPSLRVEPYNKKKDLKRNYSTGLAFPYISIKATGHFFNEDLAWEMYTPTSTFNIKSAKYSEAFNTFIDIVDKEKKLPVLAFYSDCFPHIESNKTKLNKTLSTLRNFGYYQWNEETACSSIWIERYERTWREWERHDRKIRRLYNSIHNADVMLKNQALSQSEHNETVNNFKNSLVAEIEERDKLLIEVDAIKECLVKFTEKDSVIEILNLFIDVYEEELCIEEKTNNNILFRKLPAGYKRLLYIVLDIAYRSYILNGTTQSSGIVIIDEIDLHLHPSLEQTVLQRLHATFPNIQFIVSTHSALVIANLDTSINEGEQTNKVYMMQADTEEPILLPNLFGVDYNAAIRDFMDTPARNENVKYLIDEFLSFKSMGLETEATSTYAKIKELVGDSDTTVLKEIEERTQQL